MEELVRCLISLSNTDAFAYGMEADARLRSTVVSIVVLDRSPDWDVLVDRFERVSRQMPMFRQHVVPTIPPAPPRWVYDPDFDLRFHLRRVIAPAPGTLDTVLEMARNAEMAEFDHARPMWTVTLVDGLTNGGAALVIKLHHSMADGIGALQIAMLVFDLQAEPADLGPLPPVPASTAPGPFDALGHAVRYDVELAGHLVKTATLGGAKALLAGVRDPVGTAMTAVATTASIYRTVRPINTTLSPIMTDRRMRPGARRAHGAAGAAQGGRPPRRRPAQRRLPGRRDRRAPALSREARGPGRRAPRDDADQRPRRR